jgi:hypothetical protein
MPKTELHCKYSIKRTGKNYIKLHEWMDLPAETLGIDHRRVRHDLSYIPEVIEKFGKEAVAEFLMHISADYKSSAKKWGLNKKNKENG